MDTPIHSFRHRAMATHFELRLADTDAAYGAQAAQAIWDRIDAIEGCLSRFRPQSEIRRIAALQPGESMRLSEDTFACLSTAAAMEDATRGAFSPAAAALQHQPVRPAWSLAHADRRIHCESGRLDFDLGAIGKGFALDRAADLLWDWECAAFLLIAGGSSVVAGEAPPQMPGWSCGLGDDDATERLLLANASLSGSGLAVKGSHILDPRTGLPAHRLRRAWAVCDTGAESDAFSTAAMVLPDADLPGVLEARPTWTTLLEEEGQIRAIGERSLLRERNGRDD